MREIKSTEITDRIAAECIRASRELPPDALAALESALQREESPVGRDILALLLENAAIAKADSMPLCQDTGVAVFFVELGADVHISGATLDEAINEGVRRGYADGYLRKSIVASPLPERINTGDNTPAIIHTRIVPGDGLKAHYMAKGGGSENMSRVAMLRPSDGVDGVRRFVIETVEKAWANPCPPVIVGVGIGGNFEKCAIMAKHSLLRELGSENPDSALGELEKELLSRINSLGIGPQGLGGRITALAVHIESHPCHIASLPVAVNIECHSHRHSTIVF